ncbi:DUF3054 domain-containing protein [Knoellia sp. p5-6-4]|uniref:DUF3054 domain-containing protein n=1 Tax=unclassified Knoellia TaxID=2618719 RepID=UPI0023D9DCE7|nr:DUF3054 domain-containing protein [Knoellia sp. p5-6-4]MDF2145656.1 DUF3054 domain-containing protein [Knoellia sp. p5-6-4]
MRAGARPVVGALAADALAVLLFAAAGRSSHAEGVTPDGVLLTAWPFLTGTALGWLVVRARHRRWPVPRPAVQDGPGSLGRVMTDGAVVWAAAVAGGMVLRRATGAGIDPAFVVVATLVLGALLLGWRAGWSAFRPRRRPTWARRPSARPGGARGRSSRPT